MEQVPQMRAAVSANDLLPELSVSLFLHGLDAIDFYRCVKAGPAGARVVFYGGAEKAIFATDAFVDAPVAAVIVFARERRLGSLVPAYSVLVGS